MKRTNKPTASNTSSNALMTRIRSTAVELLPDSDRYKVRFKVRSASSNQLYLISYDNAPGAQYWTCSCRGNIRHGQCKHLTAAGLKGRAYGRQSLESYVKGELAHA
jgi:hypothetical protein